MKTTAEYLDDAKEKLDVTSDYALANRLEISRQAISQYRSNVRAFDNYACMKISQVTGFPLESLITDMEMIREKDEKRREAWGQYMKRLGGLAAMVMIGVLWAFCAVVTMKVTSSEAEANDYKASPAAAEGSSLYYVKS